MLEVLAWKRARPLFYSPVIPIMERGIHSHSTPTLPSMSDENEPTERSPRAIVFCQAPRLELPPLRHTVGIDHVTLSDPGVTLRDYHVPAKHVFGHCHPAVADAPTEQQQQPPTNGEDTDDANNPCLLCSPDISEFHPFLKIAEGNLAMERDAIAKFIVDNRGIVRDASTWLAARIDWQITSAVHGYFTMHYPLLCVACDKVNLMVPHELDGRSLTSWSESGFKDEFARPKYCSWLFIPDTISDDNIGSLRMFYISTRHPLESDVLTYLFTVLRPPKPLIQAIASFTNRSEYFLNYLGLGGGDQLKGTTRSRNHSRTQSNAKRLASPEPPVELTLAGYETHDPRDARADREEVELSVAVLKRMHNLTTRLILYSTDTRIVTLQPRPDYILTPHAHYLNVFSIELPPDASELFESVLPSSSTAGAVAAASATPVTLDERW